MSKKPTMNVLIQRDRGLHTFKLGFVRVKISLQLSGCVLENNGFKIPKQGRQ